MGPRLTTVAKSHSISTDSSHLQTIDLQPATMSTMETIRTLGAATAKDFPTNRDRTEAISACQTLLTKLQDPFERVWEAVVDFPALVASIKLCLDLDLFRIWKSSGNGDQSSHDLAGMVGLRQDDMLGKAAPDPPTPHSCSHCIQSPQVLTVQDVS